MRKSHVLLVLSLVRVIPVFTQDAILLIDVEKYVFYVNDTPDVTMLARNPAPQSFAAFRTFSTFIGLADITRVNGKASRGTLVQRSTALSLNPNGPPGQSIADVQRGNFNELIFEIQQEDGTPIGTITASGFLMGPPPPGAPAVTDGSNLAVTGGTGAFAGVRGQGGWLPIPLAGRGASAAEDPANRRVHGGGGRRYVFHLIAVSPPEIISVFHDDFSPVTVSRPARAGELLRVWAKSLGPTRTRMDPGQPFPEAPLAVVNSPVEVLVNGVPAEVVNQVAVPGTTDTYRVDFCLPQGTAAGSAEVRLSVAWFGARKVNLPIQ